MNEHHTYGHHTNRHVVNGPPGHMSKPKFTQQFSHQHQPYTSGSSHFISAATTLHPIQNILGQSCPPSYSSTAMINAQSACESLNSHRRPPRNTTRRKTNRNINTCADNSPKGPVTRKKILRKLHVDIQRWKRLVILELKDIPTSLTHQSVPRRLHLWNSLRDLRLKIKTSTLWSQTALCHLWRYIHALSLDKTKSPRSLMLTIPVLECLGFYNLLIPTQQTICSLF